MHSFLTDKVTLAHCLYSLSPAWTSVLMCSQPQKATLSQEKPCINKHRLYIQGFGYLKYIPFCSFIVVSTIKRHSEPDITMSMGSLVYFEVITHILLWCCKSAMTSSRLCKIIIQEYSWHDEQKIDILHPFDFFSFELLDHFFSRLWKWVK